MAKPDNEIIVTWDDLNVDTPDEKIKMVKTMEETNKIRFDSGRSDPLYSDELMFEVSPFDKDKMNEEEGFQEDDGLPPLEE